MMRCGDILRRWDVHYIGQSRIKFSLPWCIGKVELDPAIAAFLVASPKSIWSGTTTCYGPAPLPRGPRRAGPWSIVDSSLDPIMCLFRAIIWAFLWINLAFGSCSAGKLGFHFCRLERIAWNLTFQRAQGLSKSMTVGTAKRHEVSDISYKD